MAEMEKSTLRHEIIHAFLYESGLDWSSGNCTDGWAVNEEMIDWFAIQSPKIQQGYLWCFGKLLDQNGNLDSGKITRSVFKKLA